MTITIKGIGKTETIHNVLCVYENKNSIVVRAVDEYSDAASPNKLIFSKPEFSVERKGK